MSETADIEKIHNYVTWPERETEVLPNGDVTLSALGFPVANESGVRNDGTCECADGSDGCEPPLDVSVDFDSVHGSGDIQALFRSTVNVIVSNDDGTELTIPVGKLDFASDNLTLTMADDFSGLDGCVMTLVRGVGTDDPLTETQLITNETLDVDDNDGNVLKATLSSVDNSFDMPSDVSARVFAVKVKLPDTPVVVELTGQEPGSAVGNGVYRAGNGVFAYIRASMGEATPADLDEVLSDPTALDNVGTCCGPHFRKTYAHDEIHDYVQGKVGPVTGFGVFSDMGSCRGSFIDWFLSSGIVDIGNRKGFPVYVNGFGLGAFMVGMSSAFERRVAVKEDEEEDAVCHPWMTWSMATTEDTPDNLPRDWPFTDSTDTTHVFSNANCANNVTLVKNGVNVPGVSTPVGNLMRDEVEDDRLVRKFYNRHHFVINQSIDKVEGSYSLKPLFIHLPAPIDTEDGETYEITVSIQNIPEEAASSSADNADLSAYYAAMSQPRVYVLGGRQQFSNRKIPCTVEKMSSYGTDLRYDVVLSKPALDVAGEALPDGTQVRANIAVSLDGKSLPSITAFGDISYDGTDMTIQCTGKLPVDRQYYREGVSMYVCGIAYLADAEDNPSDERMGLVRDDKLLGEVTGSGTPNAFDQYNKFFSIDEKEGHTAFPHVDRRYLLATVYQTATGTFPWRMNGRKKIQRLDRVATDFTRSSDILQKVYNSDKAMVTNVLFDGIARDEGDLLTTPDVSPVSYAKTVSWNNLASILQVSLPESLFDAPVTAPYGNPVRQACEAVRNFTSDLYRMRAVLSGADYTPTAYSVETRSSWPSGGATIIGDSGVWAPNHTIGNDSIEADIMRSTLRSLPEYVVYADRYAPGDLLKPTDGADSNLFRYNDGFYAYAETAPYLNYGDRLASSAAVSENDCDLIGNPAAGMVFSDNSVVKSLIAKGHIRSLEQKQLLGDLRRYADVSLKVDLTGYTDIGNMPDECFSPFTKIEYRDGFPIPDVGELTLTGAQKQFLAFDAVQFYSMGLDMVSSRMPYSSSKALADFVAKYVPARGADMPIRFYKGRRIALANGELPADTDPIYKKNITRVQGACGEVDENFLTHYIDDLFVKTENVTADPNVDYVDIPGVSIAATCAPYETPNEVDLCAGKTYTRVRMQFTFSQRAGRWYTTEYRQYPCNYLSPLYGNDALTARAPSIYDEDGKMCVVENRLGSGETTATRYLWRNSACTGLDNYRAVMYAPYSSYPPMDITLGCVPYMFETWPYDANGKLDSSLVLERDTGGARPEMSRLYARPWKEYSDGGIGLYPPADCLGGHKDATDGGVQANFWSVRQFIRPATSILEGTDIPKYIDIDHYDENDSYRSGGDESDPTLYSMFDFPKKAHPEYIIPSSVETINYILYRGVPEDRDQVGPISGNQFVFGYGSN